MQHLREVAIDHQNGIFAGTNELIEKIGGHPPMTWRNSLSTALPLLREYDSDERATDDSSTCSSPQYINDVLTRSQILPRMVTPRRWYPGEHRHRCHLVRSAKRHA